MRQGILFAGIISLLCLLPAPGIHAQSLQEVKRFADRQLESGNIQVALKEYQRVLLFDEQNEYPGLYERIASIYFGREDFNEAIRYYDLAWRTGRTDSARFEMALRKTLCYFRQEQFLMALAQLYDMPEELPPRFEFRRQVYLGICRFGLNEIPASLEHFATILDSSSYHQVEEMLTDYAQYREKYDPDRLQTMSIVLPGLGQLYGGEPAAALNSVGLLTAIGFYSYYTTLQYSLLDGFLVFGSLFYRYYSGGHKKAYEIGERLLEQKQSETYHRLLQLLR